MNEYNRLAQQIIAQLGEGRALVEEAAAACDYPAFCASLKFFSDKYFEAVGWALDDEGRRCLEEAIKVELQRG